MVKGRSFNKNKKNRIYVNGSILASKVRCIDQTNENIGVIETRKAILMAEDVGLDLVQITNSKKGDIPTCKIIDYGKYKYDLSKKNKLQSKKQRESAVKIKEVKFRPSTGTNDLETKAKMAKKFLDDGCRVKVVIFFKGRESQHKDIAYDRLDEFLDMVGNIHQFDQPIFEGRCMHLMIGASKSKQVVEKAS